MRQFRTHVYIVEYENNHIFMLNFFGLSGPVFYIWLYLFVCFDSLCPSQQFFSPSGVEPVLSSAQGHILLFNLIFDVRLLKGFNSPFRKPCIT